MQLLRKTQSQFTRLDQQQIFFRQTFNLKFSSSELEQFYSSSEKLFFRVQVRVRQNNRVFLSSSSSSQPCLALCHMINQALLTVTVVCVGDTF